MGKILAYKHAMFFLRRQAILLARRISVALAKVGLQLRFRPQCSMRTLEATVALTSFPGRIKSVHTTIRSLLAQSVAANRIVLVLGPDVDPKSIPTSLSRLEGERFEIWHVTEDLGSHNKYFDVVSRGRGRVAVVTCDDDMIYDRHFLRDLERAHSLYPKSIIPIYGNRFLPTGGPNEVEGFVSEKLWEKPSEPSTGLRVEGKGTLYPSGYLDRAVSDFHLVKGKLAHPKNGVLGGDDSYLTIATILEGHTLYPARRYPRWFGLSGLFAAETGAQAESLGSLYQGGGSESVAFGMLCRFYEISPGQLGTTI